MRYLITGGGGFLGVRLAERLIAAGEEVVVLDRFFAPTVRARLGDRVAYQEVDLTDQERFWAVLTAVQPEVVVHLAALLSEEAEIEPVRAFLVNVVGTFLALEGSRRVGVRRFVFTSSAAVYDAVEPVPPLTEDVPLQPYSAYGMQKATGEAWCLYYHRRYGLDARIARPAAVLGPGRTWGAAGGFAAQMVEAAARGEPYVCPLLPEDASPIIYHRDIVEGLWRLARAETVPARIYNFGAGQVTAGELARLIRERIPSARITFEPRETVRQVVRRWRYVVQDCRRAERDLGWRVEYPLPRMIDAFLAELELAAGGR